MPLRSVRKTRLVTPLHTVMTFLGATMILGMALVPLAAPHPASAASNLQLSPEEMIASLDGVETAYARRYVGSNHVHGFVDATPMPGASPAAASADMSFAEVTILQFDTEANAEKAWKLTTGSLVAGAVMHEDPAELVATEVRDLGDDARMYLMPDATGSSTEANGILFVRSGTMGIIVSGRGETSNAALGERMQAFAAFILDQPAPSAPVNVVQKGVATGGDFDRMPGPGDTDILQGLIPMYDYDLLVSNSPIQPNGEQDCGCALPPVSTPTPKPACACTPPKHG